MEEKAMNEFPCDGLPPPPGEPICRICGCWDWNPCQDEIDGPCWWVEENLCSACAAAAMAASDPVFHDLWREDEQ